MGNEALTRKHWRAALRAGSTVLDLSGALDQETGVLVRAPWLGSERATAICLLPAVAPAHPAALALSLLLERLQQAAPVRYAAATVVEPASAFGRAAMDELHQQTVSLLSFQGFRGPFTMRRPLITCLADWARAPKSTWQRRKRKYAGTMRRWAMDAGRRLACR